MNVRNFFSVIRGSCSAIMIISSSVVLPTSAISGLGRRRGRKMHTAILNFIFNLERLKRMHLEKGKAHTAISWENRWEVLYGYTNAPWPV